MLKTCLCRTVKENVHNEKKNVYINKLSTVFSWCRKINVGVNSFHIFGVSSFPFNVFIEALCYVLLYITTVMIVMNVNVLATLLPVVYCGMKKIQLSIWYILLFIYMTIVYSLDII